MEHQGRDRQRKRGFFGSMLRGVSNPREGSKIAASERSYVAMTEMPTPGHDCRSWDLPSGSVGGEEGTSGT
jgi:hypothetical protein